MIGILGEDRSDAAALVVLIRRLLRNERYPVRSKGYSGCGELRRKAAAQIKAFRTLGASKLIICHDADRLTPEKVRKLLKKDVLDKLPYPNNCCLLVPVEELEAWLLADESALTKVVKTLIIKEVHEPELIESPKEYLIRRSEDKKKRAQFYPTTHNEVIVKYLDIKKLYTKCPSFRPLCTFLGIHESTL